MPVLADHPPEGIGLIHGKTPWRAHMNSKNGDGVDEASVARLGGGGRGYAPDIFSSRSTSRSFDATSMSSGTFCPVAK